MGKPECEPYNVAIRAIELLKQQQNAAYDLAIKKLQDERDECERTPGTPPNEEPPPDYPGLDGVYDSTIILMPPGEEGPQ